MAPASLTLTLFEPVVYLRGQSATGEDARGRRRAVDFDAAPSQLRGLLTLHLSKPSRIRDISVQLRGTARTDWPEGIGHNRLELGEESIIFKQSVSLFSAKLDPQPRRRAQSIGPGTSCPDFETSSSASNEWRPTASGSTPEDEAAGSGGLARVAQVAARALAPAKNKQRPSMQRIGSAGTGSSAPATTSSSSGSFSSASATRASSSTAAAAVLPPSEPPPSYHQDLERGQSTPAPTSPVVTTTNPLELVTNPLAPQSISAAGPDGRSILHSPGRQERAAERAMPNAAQAVRFGAAAAPVATENVAAQPSLQTASTSVAPMANGISPVNSRRQSMDASSLTTSPSAAANGKAKAKKSGIKGLLGGLLKEGDNAEEKGIDEESGSSSDWREFKKGTYTYAISLPLPSALPPTLHADFGSNVYVVRGHVSRAGPLTANLVTEREVVLVHVPDEDGREEAESIVVERTWEESLAYAVVISGKSFPVGAKVPIWCRFVPLTKVKIHRFTATLEERTDYFAKGRRVARHEVPRRWTLLKIADAAGAPLAPIISDDVAALQTSPLGPYAAAASATYSAADAAEGAGNPAGLLDPLGPWEMAAELQLPTCPQTRVNISTNHAKSNISVHHVVRISIRVERADVDGKQQLFDINIKCPIALTHSQTANAWLSLPDYWSLDATPNMDDAVTTDEAPLHAVAMSTSASSPGATLRQRLPVGSASTMLSPSSTYNGTSTSTSAPVATMSDAVRSELRNARQDVDPVAARTALQQLGRRWLALSTSHDGRDAHMGVAVGSATSPPEELQGGGERPPDYWSSQTGNVAATTSR